MRNGGLRHAHPGGVVVNAHIFKIDSPDHFLLVMGELPDCGVEPLLIGGAGKERVMILIPGNTVESLDITELADGGAACE